MLHRSTALLLSLALAACTSGTTADSSPGTGATPATGTAANLPPSATGHPKGTENSGEVDVPVAPASCTPGAPGELYALSVQKLDQNEALPLCTLRGSVVLVVNGASGCGYTPQYGPLQKLYGKYNEEQKKPFEVLAFPSKSFNQEKDTDADVSQFCTTEYHITFPLFTIGPVVDDAAKSLVAQPVYKWIYAQPNMSAPVAWNFEKFLVSKDGKVVKRWLSAVSPDEGGEIEQAIVAELGK